MSRETTTDGPPAGKLAYAKPGFRTINLLAEEVMVVGCKLPASAGPFSSGPGGVSCTIPSPCQQFSGVS